MSTATIGSKPARSSAMRMIGWLAVASMLAVALLGPSAASVAALTGAVYTSNFDGSIINENVGYPSKSDVYLTGGPCNGGSHLAPGDYYFEVTSPSGDLLSQDALANRKFTVGANGFISSTSGTHLTHPVNCDPAVVGITIQLMPYADTPNNGGEYKLIVASAESVEECDGFDGASTDPIFQICNQADQKSDNYKVGEEPSQPPASEPPASEPPASEPPASEPPASEPPASEPPASEPPSPSFSGGVNPITGAPTLPPTDGIATAAQPGSDTWRVLLVVMAALLASILVLTPNRSSVRR